MRTGNSSLEKTLDFVACFYDRQKFGCEGCEGYRKSTDLLKFTSIILELRHLDLLDGERTIFLDLGCADGRVNMLLSYLVRVSIGIEIDPLILEEYEPRKKALAAAMEQTEFMMPSDVPRLFLGNSLDAATYERIRAATGVGFGDVDLFYTYITLHDLFGEKIALEGKRGALYLVYGFNKVLPRYDGLEVLIPDVGSQSIAALYRKP